MTIRYLEIFIAVCETKSTVKAASALHISQPAVSLAIKEIENYYNVVLFDRIGRSLLLTDSGRTFLEKARKIVSLFNSLSQLDEQKVTIGSSITIGTYMMPQLIATIKEKDPSLTLSTIVSDSLSIVKLLKEGKIDLGLIETPLAGRKDIESKPFFNDALVAASSQSHTLAKKGSISLEELAAYPLILREKGCASRNIVDALFEKRGIVPTISFESISNYSIVEAAKHHVGIAILPTLWAERNGLSSITINDENLKRSYFLIYLKQKEVTKGMTLVEQTLFAQEEMRNLF